MTKIDGLEIVMTKQMQKMIDKELKKRFEELKLELATRYEELLNMRNMEADQFNDGFNDARAGKLETDHPHYDLDTDNWRLGYAWGMFEPMKEKLARERQVSDAEIEELGAQEAERKEFCPNCEADVPCTHEAELFVCDICGEDFAKYIVLRNCTLPDVSMTQDVLTDIKTPSSIENTNPDYYKQELARIAELSQAVGLITTLKPTMVMDTEHPLDMAKEVVEYVTVRIAELETKIRHNALWQASEDAEERAHLEKLVPDLKKRIAELKKDNDEFRQLIHDWIIILTPDDGYVPDSECVRQAMLVIDKECEE